MPVDSATASDPLRRRLRRLSAGERAHEARAFIERFHRETGRSGEACARRTRQVSVALARFGHYEHSAEELAFGARVAWRNNARCIGRLFWQSLEVVDARAITRPDDMASQVVEHLRNALGDGRIKSMITVFAPVRGHELPAFVENRQAIQYAGYLMHDGRVVGDRQNVEATRIAISLGWQPPARPGSFDVLPLIIRDPGGRRLIYRLPAQAVREVGIVHPTLRAVGELGLRWYAVPCVSGMVLSIGGIDYPCAPFNGFYMATEIASRNLLDESRYDLLDAVARAIGERPDAHGPPLWKDSALLELNRAVLHSFTAEGITLVDHHTASEQYMQFVRREQAAGRTPSADWAWIVPPQASPACPVFHLPMQDLHAVPNFYHSRALDGAAMQPNHEDELRSRAMLRLERIRRRWWRWRRRYA